MRHTCARKMSKKKHEAKGNNLELRETKESVAKKKNEQKEKKTRQKNDVQVLFSRYTY